jgi:hypothetical protein
VLPQTKKFDRCPAILFEEEQLMAANPISPIACVHEVQAIGTQVREEKTLSLKQRVKRFLYRIFSGHEEFLGWTPD